MDFFLRPPVEDASWGSIFFSPSGQIHLPPLRQCESCQRSFYGEHYICPRCMWCSLDEFEAEEADARLEISTLDDDTDEEGTEEGVHTIPPLKNCELCMRSFLGHQDLCARCRWYERSDLQAEWDEAVAVVSTLEDDIDEEESCEDEYATKSESTSLPEGNYSGGEVSEHLWEMQNRQAELVDCAYDSDDEMDDHSYNEDESGEKAQGEESEDDMPIGGARLKFCT